MKKGRLFIISAPSGAGKSTVIEEMRKRVPELAFSISYTTRPKRAGETDGVDYIFVDKSKFDEMIRNDEFVEWAHVHDHLYGTLKRQLEEMMQKGRDVLLDIDVQGGANIKRQFPDAISIFLLPPDMETLKRRLAGRGTDKEEEIELRLANARMEMKYRNRYDHNVINDTVGRASENIIRIMKDN